MYKVPVPTAHPHCSNGIKLCTIRTEAHLSEKNTCKTSSVSNLDIQAVFAVFYLNSQQAVNPT
jgi:hypothetical protein